MASGKVIFAAVDGSKRCKFPLWEDGKVRVADVLAAFDASSVEFVDDEDRMLSFLTPDASGLSTDSFIAGATVEIQVKPSAKLSGEETLLDKLLEGQRSLAKGQSLLLEGQRSLAKGQSLLAKGQSVLAKEIKNLGRVVSASVLLTLWGDIVSTATSETTENFRKALVNFYGDDTDEESVAW